MSRIKALPLVVALLAALTLSACSQDAPAPTPPGENTVVIDVRTPAEYAEGHLEGAVLLDLTGGDFEAALPGLDPDVEYLLYCRSGNRAGQAKALMADAGFSDVSNLGSLAEAASATGLPVTR